VYLDILPQLDYSSVFDWDSPATKRQLKFDTATLLEIDCWLYCSYVM